MAKRKERGIDVIAKLAWPAGIIPGVLAYGAIRYGVGWLLRDSSNPLLASLGKFAASGIYAPLAWMALGACWIGAFGSWLGSRRRKRLLERQTGLDSLRAMSWRNFEILVGEAFRRRGYTVQETGLGGADGDVDLILRKDGNHPCAMQTVENATGSRQGGAGNVWPAGPSRFRGSEDRGSG